MQACVCVCVCECVSVCVCVCLCATESTGQGVENSRSGEELENIHTHTHTLTHTHTSKHAGHSVVQPVGFPLLANMQGFKLRATVICTHDRNMHTHNNTEADSTVNKGPGEDYMGHSRRLGDGLT